MRWIKISAIARTLIKFLNNMMTLKRDSNVNMKIKAKLPISGLNAAGYKKAKKLKKYFFNLEKRNYNRKTINEIKLENDETTTDKTQILSMIQRYCSNLYNSQIQDAQDSFERFNEGMEIPKLDDAERDALDGPLSYEKCKKIFADI